MTLHDNVHLVFVSRDLDFIYTTKSKISNFLDHMAPLTYPYTQTINKGLTFSLDEKDSLGASINHPPDVILKLRQPGNLVFIHPDTLFPVV
jgi:hypothetical protein